jgi:hypothetical protein
MTQAKRARTGLRARSRGADAELDGVEGGDELGAGQVEATADGSPPRRASGGELQGGVAYPLEVCFQKKFRIHGHTRLTKPCPFSPYNLHGLSAMPFSDFDGHGQNGLADVRVSMCILTRHQQNKLHTICTLERHSLLGFLMASRFGVLQQPTHTTCMHI